MKKIILSIALCICTFAVFAQSEKYKTAMKENNGGSNRQLNVVGWSSMAQWKRRIP